MRTRRANRLPARRGSAAVEVALSLPFLFLCGIGLIWLSYAGQKRVEVASVARGEFWAVKDHHIDTDLLSWPTLSGGDREVQEAKVSRDFTVRVLGTDDLNLRTASVVASGTSWDERSVPFEQIDRLGVHYAVWGEMNSTSHIPTVAKAPVFGLQKALQLIAFEGGVVDTGGLTDELGEADREGRRGRRREREERRREDEENGGGWWPF